MKPDIQSLGGMASLDCQAMVGELKQRAVEKGVG